MYKMNNMQQVINFDTRSPINVDKLNRQNKLIYEFLKTGKRLHRHLADELFGVGNLHSRISDLRNEHDIEIQDRFVRVKDRFGNEVSCKEYWI